MQAVVCGQGFSGPTVVNVPAGTKVCYPLTFRPSNQNVIMVITHRPPFDSFCCHCHTLRHQRVFLWWNWSVCFIVLVTHPPRPELLVRQIKLLVFFFCVCVCFLWKCDTAAIWRQRRKVIIPSAESSQSCTQSCDGGSDPKCPLHLFSADWVNSKRTDPVSKSNDIWFGSRMFTWRDSNSQGLNNHIYCLIYCTSSTFCFVSVRLFLYL